MRHQNVVPFLHHNHLYFGALVSAISATRLENNALYIFFLDSQNSQNENAKMLKMRAPLNNIFSNGNDNDVYSIS